MGDQIPEADGLCRKGLRLPCQVSGDAAATHPSLPLPLPAVSPVTTLHSFSCSTSSKPVSC